MPVGSRLEFAGALLFGFADGVRGIAGVDSAFDKAVQVLQRLLGLNLPVLALEMSVAEHSQPVLATMPNRLRPLGARCISPL